LRIGLYYCTGLFFGVLRIGKFWVFFAFALHLRHISGLGGNCQGRIESITCLLLFLRFGVSLPGLLYNWLIDFVLHWTVGQFQPFATVK
jgi:hypothetical protein